MQTIKKWFSQSENRLIISVLAVGLLWRVVLALGIFPGYDEAYYYIYSHNLDWSYFDHPLMVALTTGLGVWLTGEVSQVTIRLGTLILYTGSLGLFYLTGKHLFDAKVARFSVILASIIPIYVLVFGVFTLPDVPLIFFWSAALYCAVKEFFPDSELNTYSPSYRLSILGVLMGLVCLSKYHGFILGLGLVLFCLSSPRYFRVFLSPWLWLGIALFFLTLFPLWFWNSQHDWISFQFHLSSRFKSSEPKSYNILSVLLCWLITIAVLFPPFGVMFWWVGMRSLWAQFSTFSSWKNLLNKSEEAYKKWFILCASLPLILGLMFFSGYRYISPSWTMPGFWALTLLVGEKATQWQVNYPRKFEQWLKGSSLVLVSLCLVVLLHINLGTLQKPGQYSFLGGIIPIKIDPSKEVIDIAQLRQGFKDSPVMSEGLKESDFVFTHIWFLGGLIDMAIYPLKPVDVTCFCRDRRGFQVWTKPEDLIGKNGLYITNNLFENEPELTDRYRPYFQEFEKLGTIPIYRGGEVLEVFHVYQGKNFLKPYP